MVYGGQDVVDKYATDPTVWVNGPGRAKVLVTAEQDWSEHIDLIVDSICTFGGTACVNTTAVLYEGDATPLAKAIAERLSTLVALPAADERAQLPVVSTASARSIADFLGARAAGTTPVLGADQVVADFGDGTAALRPAVHLLGGAGSGEAEHRTGVSVRLGVAVVARRRPRTAAPIPRRQRHHR